VSKYLKQTREHVEEARIGSAKCSRSTLRKRFPGARSFVSSEARWGGNETRTKKPASPRPAELVACECVVLAETKDHANWEQLKKCAEHLGGKVATAITEVADDVEDEEDEHLYHSKGWVS
jgi:hypothetical protein